MKCPKCESKEYIHQTLSVPHHYDMYRCARCRYIGHYSEFLDYSGALQVKYAKALPFITVVKEGIFWMAEPQLDMTDDKILYLTAKTLNDLFKPEEELPRLMGIYLIEHTLRWVIFMHWADDYLSIFRTTNKEIGQEFVIDKPSQINFKKLAEITWTDYEEILYNSSGIEESSARFWDYCVAKGREEGEEKNETP